MDEPSGEDVDGSTGVWPGETQVFSASECFLCGLALTEENRTDEHVFPQWLLRELDLWDARLDLLNATSIRYRQLTIPCCSECNNRFLSQIEDKVATAYHGGFEAFERLDRDVLFLWLAKIVYGLLVREQFLAEDRSNPSSEPIVSREFLEMFRAHHYLLQGAVGRVTWEGNPASILMYRTKVSDVPARNFDFCDGPAGPFLALRMGPIGIIAVLQDWGALEQHPSPQLEHAKVLELAPLQFRELMAVGRFWAFKFNRVPKYVIMQHDGVGHVVCLPLMGLSQKPLWDPFDPEEYAFALAVTVGVPVERIHIDGKLVSFLRDDNDQPWDLPFDAWYR